MNAVIQALLLFNKLAGTRQERKHCTLESEILMKMESNFRKIERPEERKYIERKQKRNNDKNIRNN